MAQVRQFRCPNCEYKAEVSGGEDRGLEVYTQTVACHDCKALLDIPKRRFALPSQQSKLMPDPASKPLVSAWVKFKMGEVARAAKPDASPAGFEHLQHYWTDVPLKCPENPYHKVVPWFGMHLPLEEEFEEQKAAGCARGEMPTSGACPRCGHRMVRSQPLATWE